MIGSLHRFHGYNSLRYVYSHGKTVRTPQLAVRYAINERRRTFRVAVVVAKKVSKSAVVRNRIRRRIYAIVRQQTPAITGPFDIVITVFHVEIMTVDAHNLQQTMRSLFEQASIIAKTS